MKRRALPVLAWTLAALALMAVFAAYLDPHVVLDLATRAVRPGA